jgi:hypothetical protein
MTTWLSWGPGTYISHFCSSSTRPGLGLERCSICYWLSEWRRNQMEWRNFQGNALESQERCGEPWPLGLDSAGLGDRFSPGSLQRGANLPVLAVVLRYSVCTGCSWQGIAQCLRGGPCPGWGPVASSVRPSWEEGRKEGLQLRRSCGFESFPLGFSCLQGVEMLREALNTWWKSGDESLVNQSACLTCPRLVGTILSVNAWENIW